MSNEFEFLERNAAKRIIGLFPPSARAAADRIKLLRGENGLAIALVIADFDPQVSEVRYRQDLVKTNLDCNLSANWDWQWDRQQSLTSTPEFCQIIAGGSLKETPFGIV